MRRGTMRALFAGVIVVATWADAAAAQNLPSVKIAAVGGPVTFATHAELEIYFRSFPIGRFPDWKTSVFESVQLTLSRGDASP
jgi:hypothetical protein